MEEIEFPLFLSSYFYTYVLCQSIFALSDIALNSLTLSAHLVPLPTLPSCFLFTVNIADQKSNPFIWNCLKKYHYLCGHHTFFFPVNVCVRAIHVCVSLVHTCICASAIACASCMLPPLWNHQHFHYMVWWVKNMLVLTSFWSTKSTIISAWLNCFSPSHSPSN